MILGLTGGYCSGKSSAAAILKDSGWAIIDVDAMGHAALLSRANEVSRLLGPEVIKPDGCPDRKAIAVLVFREQSLLSAYEAIVHPAMNELVEKAIGELAVCRGICIDAALLYRLPVVKRCDAIIEVRSPLLARLRRARLRDGIGARAAMDRIMRQRPLWIAGKAFYDRVTIVNNSGTMAALQKAVLAAASGFL